MRVRALAQFQTSEDDGEGGTVVVQHPVIVVMSNETVVKTTLDDRLAPVERQLEALKPVTARSGSMAHDNDMLTAKLFVAIFYLPGQLDEAAAAKLISEREESRQVLESLATDAGLMLEVAAKVNGYSKEEFQTNGKLKDTAAKIEGDVPNLMEYARWCVENWDYLTKLSQENGGDE